ncbi:hypothetical protein HX823_22235 [Pseudomonas sp. P7759]|uniref:hypothetical protein n=1 Tax=Pseudomonas sp. P7759 TaxID=2738831 RepID=UPI0015A074FB|nr:hypothetical protein [Pseudomonas sp. P7759]NWC76801.1 hypothetical protein [Pseudomonas sp. P7759]
MSNVSTQKFVPMNTGYTQLNQPSVQMDKAPGLSPSMDSVSKFLKDTNPASKDTHVPMNKESLEKLFAMFEFAVKAMRSMLAGMGVLPKLPGEADAQPQVKPGPDAKVVADTAAQSKVAPAADTKPKVMPAADNKVATDTGVQPKVTAEADTKPKVMPGADTKVAMDTGVQPKVTPQADARAKVEPKLDTHVTPDRPAQVTITPDGKPNAKQVTTTLTDVAQQNKLSSDINVIVQVQNCHCPHTDEKTPPQPRHAQPVIAPKVDVQPTPPLVVTPTVETKPAPQPAVTPKIDAQPTPPPVVTPKVETKPAPQPAVTPKVDAEPTPPLVVMPKVETKPTPPSVVTPKVDAQPTPPPVVTPNIDTKPTPEITSPAPDNLADDFARHSHSRFSRSSLRSRF